MSEEYESESRGANGERSAHTFEFGEGPVIYSALLGISVVAVIQLLQVTELDIPLTISVHAFALGIPLLAGFVLTLQWPGEEEELSRWGTFALVVLFATGLVSTLVGLLCLFLHFSWAAGVLFGLAGIGASWTVYKWAPM